MATSIPNNILSNLPSLSPFGRLSDFLKNSSSAGGSNSQSGSNPFGSGISSLGKNLPYGGNPFAGDNLFTIFGGGKSPLGSGSNPFAGGKNPFGSGSNPFAGGKNPFGSGSNPFAGGKNPVSSGSNPFAGGKNPFGSGSNPFAGGKNPVSSGSNPFSSVNSAVPLLGGHNNSNYFAGINNLILGDNIQFAVGKDIQLSTSSNTLFGDGNTLFGSDAPLIGGTNNHNYFAGINNLVFGNGIKFAVGDNINFAGGNTKPTNVTSPSSDAVTTTVGGNGNDTFYAGVNTQLVGGEGKNIFFAGEGGNTLIGNQGADQFWIATGSLPKAADVIADFKVGSDVIGISGLPGATKFSDLTLTPAGDNTLISLHGHPLAIVAGVPTGSLHSSSFRFS